MEKNSQGSVTESKHKGVPLLKVEDLKVEFTRDDQKLSAVDGLSFNLEAGKVLGVVGESGSGKSVSVMTLLGLNSSSSIRTSGSAKFGGRDLLSMEPGELQKIRGKEIGMVFQNPMSSLNPTMRIGDQIAEGMLYHGVCPAAEVQKQVIGLLDRVGIREPQKRYKSYPHEFSGGMRQRVMIAMALSCQPRILIADEPTTALDVTMEKQILDLILEMKHEFRLAVILITHNLPLALNHCDNVLVMYAGKIMESGTSRQLIHNTRHPYTTGLFNSHLGMGNRGKPLIPIPGQIPLPTQLPPGCRFHPRCPEAIDKCQSVDPALLNSGDESGHLCACLLRE